MTRQSVRLYSATGVVLSVAVAVVVARHFFSADARPSSNDVARAPTSAPTKGREVAAAQPAKARTPAEVLLRHATRLPSLEAWAANWKTPPEGGVTASVADELRELIAASDLSAQERLAIADLLVKATDSTGGLVWAQAALNRIPVDLAERPDDHAAAVVLRTTLDEVGPVLWKVWDPDTLKGLIHAESLLPRLNDWDEKPEWHRVNLVRGLIDHQEYAAALDAVEEIDRELVSQHRFKDGQIATLRRHQANALSKSGNLTEAKAVLEQEVASTDPKRSAAARSLLVDVERRLLTPLSIAARNRTAPAALIDWVRDWQTAPPEARPNSVQRLDTLKRLLDLSEFPGSDLLTIGQCLNDAGDPRSALTWLTSGVHRTYAEFLAIRRQPSQPQAAVTLVEAAIPIFDVVGPMLWMAKDGDAQLKLTEMLSAVPRSGAGDQRREWARLGHAEALYLLGRYDEGTAELAAMSAEIEAGKLTLTDDQTREYRWAMALLNYATGKYGDAAPEFSALARDAVFQHSADAWELAAVAFARAGDKKKAERVVDDWIVTTSPSKGKVVQLMLSLRESGHSW